MTPELELKNKIKENIWIRASRYVARSTKPQPINRYDAIKEYLHEQRAKCEYMAESRPKRNSRSHIEYMVYDELIDLCTRNRRISR